MPKVRLAKDCLSGFSVAERAYIFGNLAVDDPKVIDRINTVMQQNNMEKYQAKQQAIAIDRILTRIEADPQWATKPGKVLTGILTHPFNSKYAGTSVEARKNAIVHTYQGELAEIFESFRPKGPVSVKNGFRLGFESDPHATDNMVRAIFAMSDKFPKVIDDPQAMAFAKAWMSIAKKLSHRYNRAGGHMITADHMLPPQRHDPSLVRMSTFKQWFSYIDPLIKREGFMNEFDDILPFDDYVKEMNDIYQNIRTEGLHAMKPGSAASRNLYQGKMANRYSKKKTIVFKEADGWLQYHKQYGLGTPWGAMQTHIERMGRDIAMMETMGPDPDAVFNLIQGLAREKSGTKTTGRFAEMVYKNLAGRVHAEGNKWFDGIHVMRNLETAMRLGFAPVAAVGDILFEGQTARLNGMSATKVLKRHFTNLAPGNWREERVVATRLGLGAYYALDRINSNLRYAEATGYEKASWFADTSVRFSGLNRWTNIGRASFGLEFSGHMADIANRFPVWDTVPTKFKSALQRYNINAKDWERIIGAEQLDYDGAKYIDPRSFNEDEELLTKFLGMVADETNFAIPEANIRTRSLINQGHPSNTVVGEMLRLFGQFKAFPITASTMHMGRSLEVFAAEKGISRLSYMSSMAIGGTILGTMVVQAREVAHGKGLRDWDNTDLWMEGFAQAGVLGPIGDILFRDNKHQMNPVSTFLVGPVISDMDYALRNGYAAAGKMMDGDPSTNPGSNLSNILNRVTPAENWYTHLILRNAIWSHLLQATDPQWRDKRRNMSERMEETKKQDEPWWKDGQPLPEFMR